MNFANKQRLFWLIIFIFLVFFSFFKNQVHAQTNFPVSEKVSNGSSAFISPFIWGAGLQAPSGVTTSDQFFSKISETQIRSLGLKLLRFPNGCYADLYNYKTSTFYRIDTGATVENTTLSIDEALLITQRVGAQMLYTINIETKGLTNPCAWTTGYKGTLQDAVEIVTKYKGKIHNYELGNESWGFWTPADYGQEAIKFATAMKQVDPTIKISIQGFPTTGNNQDPDQPVQSNDTAWTNMIKGIIGKQCSGVPCFDFVTDHPYVYAGYDKYKDNNLPINFAGMAAYYPLTNYNWMFDQRKTDYAPAKLDITEWNLKCWGPVPGTGTAILLSNSSFENTIANWNYWSRNQNTGKAEVNSDNKIDGNSSAKLILGPSSGQPLDDNQVTQQIEVQPSKVIQAIAYVKTNHPENVNFIIQQTNPGEHQWAHAGEVSLKNIKANTWQQVMVEGTTFSDTTKIQIVLRNTKTKDQWAVNSDVVISYFDNIRVVVPAALPYGYSNAAINTAENGFFTLESMLLMAQKGVHTNVYHALLKGSACTFYSSNDKINTQGQAYSFSSVLAGGKLLAANTDSPQNHIRLDPGCKAAGCLKGGVDAPYVSSYGGVATDGTTYIFITNRHESQAASTTVDLSELTNINAGNLTAKYLSAKSYTDKIFSEYDKTISLPASKKITLDIPPISVVRLKISTSVVDQVPGDLNGDKKVNITDYKIFVPEFGNTGSLPADFNKSGKVDIYDYNILISNFKL